MAKRKANKPELDQHPAASGHEDVEVAERAQDTEASTAGDFQRVLVVPVRDFTDTEEFHRRQCQAIADQAVQQGLRLDGDVSLQSKDTRGGQAYLTYGAPVTPAAVTTRN